MNNEKKTASAKKKPDIKGFVKRRSTRRGAVSIVITVLFIAAIVLVNIVLSAITDRHPLYIDATENASYRLQQETKDFLKEVKEPVDIYVLSKESDFENTGSGSNYQYLVQANKLLHAMDSSSKYVKLHYIDLVSNPSFQTDYPKVNWTDEHILLVTCGDMYHAIDFDDLFAYDQQTYYNYGTRMITSQTVEQAVMSAILNVTTVQKSTVTVIEGHGEQDMSAFIGTLENNAYNVETITMPGGEISAESEFVILYAPDVDLDEATAQTLTDWLDNDGKYGHHLFYMPHSAHDTADFPRINAILDEYGMKIEFGFIVDSSYATSYTDPYQARYDYGSNSTYTEDLRNPDVPVVMTYTMPITITETGTTEPLLMTSEQAVMMYQKDDNVENTDAQVFTAAAIGRHGGGEENKSSSVVVIGSPFAVASSYLSNFNNAAYFVNLFNTLSDHEGISVVIEGKDPSAKTLGLTTLNSVRFPAILVRFVIPLGVLVIGIVIWLRRRHR